MIAMLWLGISVIECLHDVIWKKSKNILRNCLTDFHKCTPYVYWLLSFPKVVWRLIVFAPFLSIIIIITLCIIIIIIIIFLSFFLCNMNVFTADLRNYWIEFHETWWSYRYMFLVGPKVFSFVVKGVKVIFWGFQRGWGLL